MEGREEEKEVGWLSRPDLETRNQIEEIDKTNREQTHFSQLNLKIVACTLN